MSSQLPSYSLIHSLASTYKLPVFLRSYTLASLLELADISLPEDFGEDELEVAVTGLQNRPQKVLH